ncbi:MAG: hypothetical protein WB586_12430 [Chthoniobacterales bacterium]
MGVAEGAGVAEGVGVAEGAGVAKGVGVAEGAGVERPQARSNALTENKSDPKSRFFILWRALGDSTGDIRSRQHALKRKSVHRAQQSLQR